MCDVNCPYCGTEQFIDHDGGYGFEEDVRHEQVCSKCDMTFFYRTVVSYDYYVEQPKEETNDV